MVRISPSLLSSDCSRLGEELQQVAKAGADMIHLDIMDGDFVPMLSFGPSIIKSLPHIEGCDFDAHLMVQHPEKHIDAFVDAGVDRLVIHQETTMHLHFLLRRIQEAGIKSGVALIPSTPLESIDWVLEKADIVLLLTVDPGLSGAFQPGMIRKIEQVKERIVQRGLAVEVEVDGGITTRNIRQLADAGMDTAVAGSAVFQKPDYAAAIRALKQASESSSMK
ncbi:MAG: ribulose-phosphate 3-epimerase [SAR324 cluster bacterium]|jgi:ribulose-phosphate 3-epimerase|nr:ribulose-phosphate 3-epimerase [SAR324 cluster bacterium]|tara:strand:+ start:56 stop:721 length:666 start_codon:yes stop_codon:yes gene_type:complete